MTAAPSISSSSSMWLANSSGMGCSYTSDPTISMPSAPSTNTPNPTTNLTRLNLSLDKTADVRIEVLNTVGQTLQTIDAGKVNSLNQQIDLTRFANGTYFLRVNIDGETAIRRVVLNR